MDGSPFQKYLKYHLVQYPETCERKMSFPGHTDGGIRASWILAPLIFPSASCCTNIPNKCNHYLGKTLKNFHIYSNDKYSNYLTREDLKIYILLWLLKLIVTTHGADILVTFYIRKQLFMLVIYCSFKYDFKIHKKYAISKLISVVKSTFIYSIWIFNSDYRQI